MSFGTLGLDYLSRSDLNKTCITGHFTGKVVEHGRAHVPLIRSVPPDAGSKANEADIWRYFRRSKENKNGEN